MPKVPYSPVPSSSPQDIATPRVSVNAPAAAFGGVVGQALEGLGKEGQNVGGEIFHRATALQDLRNETERTEAVAQYEIESGKLHADFTAKTGKDAALGFDKYQKDLNDLRVNIRSGLSNSMTQKMFDSQSLGIMNRSIFNGAGHAGQENKRWVIQTGQARENSIYNNLQQNPNDDIGFENGVRELKKIAYEIKEPLLGENAEESAKKAESLAWAHRLTGMAKSEPSRARELYEKNKDKFYLGDGEKVEDTIKRQELSVETRITAETINEDSEEGRAHGGKPERSLEERVKEAEEIGDKHKNPLFKQELVRKVMDGYRQKKAIIKDDEYRNRDTIDAAIQQLHPASKEALFAADSNAEAAYWALPERLQKVYDKQIVDYALAKRREGNKDEFIRLSGLATGETKEARAEYLDTDLSKYGLSPSQYNTLMKYQKEMRKNQDADPRVNRAVSLMRGDIKLQSAMKSLKLDSRVGGQAVIDNYDKFRGELQQALDVWKDENGKPPTQKEITEVIGPAVIRQAVTGKGWFGGNVMSEPAYKNVGGVPKDWAEKAKKSEEWLALPIHEQTDEWLLHAYNRAQYQGLFQKPLRKGAE